MSQLILIIHPRILKLNLQIDDEEIIQALDRKANIECLKRDQEQDQTLVEAFLNAQEKKNNLYISEYDGLLYHKEIIGGTEVRQIVTPENRRGDVLRLAHDSVMGGHLAREKTLSRIKLSFWWPNMKSSVADYCTKCFECQGRRRKTCWDRVPITAITRPSESFEIVHVDIIGEIFPHSSSGHAYVLIMVDQYSRWPEAVPLRKLTAKATCEALLEIFARTGVASVVVSDQGSNFRSKMTIEFERILGTSPRFCTPMHPAANGSVERYNQTFKNMLHHIIQAGIKDWAKQIPFILWAYREIPNSTTGLSPFHLVYGKPARGPINILKEVWTGDQALPVCLNKSATEYLEDVKKRIATAADIATQHAEAAQQRYVLNYNLRSKDKKFEVGDEVLILEKDTDKKVLSRWIGPVPILEKQSDHSYLVKMPNGGNRIWHANHLRKFNARINHVLGVIHEEDEQFGSVECCPSSDDFEQTEVDFNQFVHKNCEELDQEQKQELITVLEHHRNVFSDRPGRCKIGEHVIRLKEGAEFPKRKIYRVPQKLQAEVDRQIDDLLNQGLIERGWGPYAHPIVCVKKPDDSIRICVDSQAINSITVDDKYPMANIEDLLMKVSKSRYITCVDCSAGYNQIPMAESSKEYTGFVTNRGLFQWKVMCFGLKNASSTYQRVMNQILDKESDYANAYIDDVAIHSDTWKEHLQHIDTVLTRLEDAGITLKLKKSKFGKAKIKFLGHVIGSGEHTVDKGKVEAIQKIVFPRTKKELRQFIGMASYYRGYVPNYAGIMKPLTELTKQNRSLTDPDEETVNAFNLIKLKLSTAPVLRAPDYNLPFEIQTDASDMALGACLCQTINGDEHPIAYASKKLTEAERALSTIEKESLAIIFSVKRFDAFIFGRPVTVYTDHNPLRYLTNASPPSAKLIRWKLALQRYNIVIKYRKGKDNGNCDALSRLPSEEG